MNGSYNNLSEWGRAILITVLCFMAAVCVALFIVVNLSPLFITVPVKGLRLSSNQIYSDYWRIIAYLQLPVVKLDLRYIPITRSAVQHFSDVRKLLLINTLTMVVTGVLAIVGLRREKRQAQLWRLSLPFQVVFVTVLFTGFLFITNFNEYFIQFHYMFFSNMNWVFDAQSNPIILLMPQSFFELLFSLVILGSLLLILAIWLWIKLSLRAFLRKL